jgi:hypothetical protein
MFLIRFFYFPFGAEKSQFKHFVLLPTYYIYHTVFYKDEKN